MINNAPPVVININGNVNIPFSKATMYAHVQTGTNNKMEVISPGENFLLTIVVPIWANNPFIAASPTNMYEKTGQSKPVTVQDVQYACRFFHEFPVATVFFEQGFQPGNDNGKRGLQFVRGVFYKNPLFGKIRMFFSSSFPIELFS
jgi:hypothetical protein